MEGVTQLPCGRCGDGEHADADCPHLIRASLTTQPEIAPATIALAIPHTPWLPDRVDSMARLRGMLTNRPKHYREFTDRESNRVWPHKLWSWGLSTGASHVLQLQDDVIVAPKFWPALRAMLEAQPDKLIGLHSNHPLSPVQHKAGRRWYRDNWLTGPAYVFPRDLLQQFVDWCAENPDICAVSNEDSLISYWTVRARVDVWHPVVAITDVDQGIPSTYGNDAHHEYSMYRRPPVTWRDVPSMDALTSVDYWRCGEASAPKLPGPGTQLCWWCGREEGTLTSTDTGARIGKNCTLRIVGGMMGMAIQIGPPP